METYIVKNSNYDIRLSSRSGGIFSVIAEHVINQKGVVYGCVLNQNLVANHIGVETIEELKSFRGSKYVQSHLGTTFRQIITNLTDGRVVLFSGTGCQVAGLRSACRNINSGKLICMDVVCFGVPSPMVYRDYLEYCQKKYRASVLGFDFRNKADYGWKQHIETIETDRGTHDSEVYTKLFYSHNIVREACFICPYKGNKLCGSDITFADAWGVNEYDNDFNDDNGVSLVIMRTEVGKKIFGMCIDKVSHRKVDYINYEQPALKAPYLKPAKYVEFWEFYLNHKFEEVVRTYGYIPMSKKIKRLIKKLKRRLRLIVQ